VSSGNLVVIELYLRVLLAIDTEVVDRDIVHTPEVTISLLSSLLTSLLYSGEPAEHTY